MGIRITVSGPEEALQSVSFESVGQLQTIYQKVFPAIHGQIDVELVSNADIQLLNAQYRSLNEPTDVLSFPVYASREEMPNEPGESPLGDVKISPEKAVAYQETILDLIHHGTLHVLGFDHETNRVEWDQVEATILQEARHHNLDLKGIPDDAI